MDRNFFDVENCEDSVWRCEQCGTELSETAYNVHGGVFCVDCAEEMFKDEDSDCASDYRFSVGDV